VVNVVGNQIVPQPNQQSEGGLTTALQICNTYGYLCNWNSVVYYTAVMFSAQGAALNLSSPTMGQNADFQQLLTAIGDGIGNTAAHELGHQLRLPDMDCDGPGHTSCPGPPPSAPWFFYEYYSDGPPLYLNIGYPLRWDNNDTNALNQQFLKK
jgi:hypothetical protein